MIITNTNNIDNSNGNTTTMETYLQGLAPCRFPRFSHLPQTLNGASGAPTRNATTAATRRPIGNARVAFDQPVADELVSLSSRDPESVGAVLRTAWALLLRCYTGQDDVSFACQLMNEPGIGEPVVVRFLLDDSASVAETIERTKSELAAGILPPVARAVSATSENVDANNHKLFDTAVVLWGVSKAATTPSTGSQPTRVQTQVRSVDPPKTEYPTPASLCALTLTPCAFWKNPKPFTMGSV